MTDIIGVLGSNTSVAVGTYTAYTVPTGKAAKVKVMYRGVFANTGTLIITVNGINIAAPAAATGADNIFSGSTVTANNTTTTAPTGASATTTVAPGPYEYYLSAGDTVTYSIGVVAAASMNFQVVGTEVDVA